MDTVDYELYGWNTPNGQKVLIALEEAGAQYNYHPIDISKGQQKTDSFKIISPDGKIPALVHHNDNDVTLFESGAILLYLADQYPRLHGKTKTDRAAVMSWVFWQVGQLGPLAGQFGRFRSTATVNTDAIEHFEVLVWRCLEVMEKKLAKTDFLACSNFTIADIAAFPWVASGQSYLQRFDLNWKTQCPAVKDWSDRVGQRPAVINALARH